MESRTSGSRGISFRSILIHSLWTILTGILFFGLTTTNGHNFVIVYIHSWPYIRNVIHYLTMEFIQLLISSTVIFLHRTNGCNLMWIVQSPSISEEVLVDHTTKVGTCSASSSPSSSLQVLKESDADEIAIRIVTEGRNKTKLLTNGSAWSFELTVFASFFLFSFHFMQSSKDYIIRNFVVSRTSFIASFSQFSAL